MKLNLSVAQVEECVFLVVWGIINSESHYQGGLGFGNRYGPSGLKKKKVQQRQGPQETSLAIKLPGQMKMAEAAKQ